MKLNLQKKLGDNLKKALLLKMSEKLKQKAEARKAERAEEPPEKKQTRKLVGLVLGIGVGSVIGVCVAKSVRALRKAQLEKAEREMSLDGDASPVIKLPDEILPEDGPEEAPQPEPEA